MEIGGLGGAGGAAHLRPEDGVLLTAPEAERLVEQLTPYPIDQVGSSKWLRQHNWVGELNLQAHHNALSHSDEFVMEALVSLDKVAVLVHELLVIEVWKERVYPLIAKGLKNDDNTINLYLALYHEAAVANLLEVTLFHRSACEAAGDDALLELVDYCQRKLLYLNTVAADDAKAKGICCDPSEVSAEELMKQTAQQEMQEKAQHIRFGVAMCSLSILRYLTDYASELPLCVMARLVSTHDVVLSLVPLLDSRPWMRRRVRTSDSSTVFEAYGDHGWVTVPPEERLKLTKPEAQVWLSLNNLLVEPKCRAKYTYDDHRKDTVLKLRRHFNELLFDQLPVLKDLQRVIEELILMQTMPPGEVQAARLILEQVPVMRERMLQGKDWGALAASHREVLLAHTLEAQEDLTARMRDMMRLLDFEGNLETPKCAGCGIVATQRCSRCKHEWYCGRKCQVSVWKRHKAFCDMLHKH
eukprot:jgi/Chlat1/8948/Chrsp94S08253